MTAYQPHQPPYLLAIDGGTEALKARLYDRFGQIAATSAQPYKSYFPHPGWAEQEPAEWWQSLVRAVRDCVQSAQINPTEIVGLSADATTCTLIPMRKDGQSLGRALLWMDVRAAEQAAQIFDSGHQALQYCLAGVNAEWMPPKMCWLKAHDAARYAAMDYLLEYTDWLGARSMAYPRHAYMPRGDDGGRRRGSRTGANPVRVGGACAQTTPATLQHGREPFIATAVLLRRRACVCVCALVQVCHLRVTLRDDRGVSLWA